jgi:hypothetical protein
MTVNGYTIAPPVPSIFPDDERAFVTLVFRHGDVVERCYGQTPGEAEAKALEFAKRSEPNHV